MRRAVLLLVMAVLACSSQDDPAPPPATTSTTPYCAPRDPNQWFDCSGPRGTGGCATKCILGCSLQCYPGFATCDGDENNGCEVSYLTDPENCGACHGRADTCVNGLAGPAPETLLTWGYVPQGLAIDATSAYFASDGTLWKIALDGSTATVLVEGEAFDARAGLTRGDDGFLHWVSGGRVRRIASTGGTVETLVSGIEPASNVVVHAGIAYVVDATPPSHLADTTGRSLVPTTGGTLFTVGDRIYAAERGGRLRAVQFDGSGIADLTASTGVAVTDGTKVYFASSVVDIYDLATAKTSHLGPIAFVVEGATMLPGDPFFYGRGGVAYDRGGCLIGRPHTASVVAAFDGNVAAARVRARVGDEPFSDPPRVAQLAVNATHVYFTTTGRMNEPATVQRFAK